MGTLSVVATPIGNLGDITLRALETLKKADVIFCEDTRVTSKLLTRYEISKPLIRCDENKETLAAQKALSMLTEGKHVALVTDAGTPGISDPGSRFVSLIRASGGAVKIEAIPGPSALTAALSIAGLDTSNFVFLGFLPHKKGRQTLFKSMQSMTQTLVFYESPHRILKTLESLAATLPATKKVVICRELTKMFEEVVSGSAPEIREHFRAHPETMRGEFVVIVSA
jgi:16S rRNA (cytidine1402-2'-O)-methyltransferase